MRRPMIVLGIMALAACGADDGGPPPAADEGTEPLREDQRAMADERVEVLAPIENAEIVVRESAPPQYAVRIVSGLPSGCAEFERIDTETRDESIALTVWNTMPADENVACTMIYRTTENTVELGADFASGETFTVSINDEETLSFTAQ